MQPGVLRREAKETQTLLMKDQTLAGCPFPPIQVQITYVRIFCHDGLDITGNPAQFIHIRSHDPEEHGVRYGWAKNELLHPHPCFGECALGNNVAKLFLERIACRVAFGLDDNLGKGRVGQFGIERQYEARHAVSDIAGDVFSVRFGQNHLFDVFDGFIGRGKGSPGRKVNVNDQFGAIRVRKKLLLHRSHTDHGQDKEHDGHAGGKPFVIDYPPHDAAKPLIVRGRINGIMPSVNRFDVRQELDAQVRSEEHSNKPRGDQCEGHYPEDVARVFTCRRFGKTNRQKAGDGNQRTE